MAFDYTNLYPDTSQNGAFTKSWNYTTVVDSVATCAASGYFNAVATRLGIGDNIIVAQVDAFGRTRTTLLGHTELFVTGISGGVVTTAVSGVTAPISGTTDNAAARYDGISGALQDSALLIDDTGNVSSFGGQIKFPATQNASSDANTLDDYEEGTWTPALTFTTPGDLAFTGLTAQGWYEKIGRTVFAHLVLTATTITFTTASGNLQFTGIPFIPSQPAGNNAMRAGGIGWQGITKAGFTDMVPAAEPTGAGFITIRANGSGQVSTAITAADIPSGGTISFRCCAVYSST